MATTTNYSWTTPDDTDLVKDGAAAIRTLGSSIDTTVFTNAGAAVAKATVDAKGDLLVGTADNTVGRLAVGTNGFTLVADSVETTGLKWQAPAATGRNFTLANAGGTTLSGSQTITVSGLSNVEQIFVLIVGASVGSGSAGIGLRLNTDTGSNYHHAGNTIYARSTYNAEITDTSRTWVGSPTTRFPLAQMSNNAASVVDIGASIFGCNSSGLKILTGNGGATNATGSGQVSFNVQGYYNSSSVISSVSAFNDTGNFDAGTVYVYTSA